MSRLGVVRSPLLSLHAMFLLLPLVLAPPSSVAPNWASTIGDGLPIAGKFLSADLYDAVMHQLPVPTADVLVLSSDLRRTLLFNRTNKPVQHVFYSLGGRILKNEHIRTTAMRKLTKELPRLGAMTTASELVLGGVMEEIFSDSAFDDTNSHCVNSVFGLVLKGGSELEDELIAAKHDSQSTRAAWFAVDDPALHPYIHQKLALLLPLPALAEKACQAIGQDEASCALHLYRNREQTRMQRCVWTPRGCGAAPRCDAPDDGSTTTGRWTVGPEEVGLLVAPKRLNQTEAQAMGEFFVVVVGLAGMMTVALRRRR